MDKASRLSQQAKERNPLRSPGAALVHDADCSIWDTPVEAQPEALFALGVRRESIAVYLSEVRPLYDAAKRCIGQLSGILLLLQTDSLDRGRDGLLLASVAQQLGELDERLRAVKPPKSAQRHAEMLAGLGESLRLVLARLERQRDLLDPASRDLDAVVETLFAAQRTLHGLSAPRFGLAPVDFTAACCNCRPSKNN